MIVALVPATAVRHCQAPRSAHCSRYASSPACNAQAWRRVDFAPRDLRRAVQLLMPPSGAAIPLPPAIPFGSNLRATERAEDADALLAIAPTPRSPPARIK